MKVYPFSQEELNIRYRYPAGNPSGLGKPEFSTPVGVKENIQLQIASIAITLNLWGGIVWHILLNLTGLC